MIELRAFVTCDRCQKQFAEMHDLDGIDEVYQRLEEIEHSQDEDGNDVCAACWEKFDAKKRSESATSVDAVDPVAGSSTS